MTDMTDTHTYEGEAQLGDYYALLKPRVMQLVVFTALVGMLAAPVSVNPVVGFASILFLAIGAGASGALNMWWDADIDAVMKRTAQRPIPAGKVTPEAALALGCALSGMAVMMLSLSANLLAGAMLAFTIFFYVVPYSMWLKRSTPQNIVIGGAAGAFPPVIGWLIATGSFALEPWLMFALIFMWTPPHFWALALFMRNDYDDANVPMLTVTHGRRSTRNHILGYTVALVVLAVGTAFTAIGGWIYLATALVLNALFLKGAWDIQHRNEDDSEADNFAVERKFFRLSLWYLFLHFGAILAEATLKPFGLGGW
ncbi:heme o synthase [Sulfitobacter sp. S190]|uniref:heme o synthase n=1 Tax=Sulfitobacter sp. S190 TaxID=2867022 RepID=UPI0021A5E461|nr:heme o synthase [Sulfitobacter sp. S190]UWR23413.1 heme o synthase [Sulfitobacter sp. S190]